MTATTITTTRRAQKSYTGGARLALTLLALAVLLPVSFLIGRATVGTSHTSPARASVSSVAPGANTAESCHVGRPC